MANFLTGNIWSTYQKPNNIILVTTNGVITRNGIVMGAGIALEAKRLEPLLPQVLADKALLKANYSRGYMGIIKYGILFNPMWNIGAFQSKYHFKHDSPLELIQHSAEELKQIATENGHFVFNVNFPGVGLGKLRPSDVKPVMKTLPNNVNVWSK